MDVAARLEALEAENDALREQVRQLRAMLRGERPMPMMLGLTGREAAVLGCLMSHVEVSKDQIMTALYSTDAAADVGIKIVDVFVCKIRKKIKRYGIVIETIWGRGFRLTIESKAAIKAMQAAEAGATTEPAAEAQAEQPA